MPHELENILTCPVCLERFGDARILPCQHTFCLLPCLANLYDISTRSIKCPICRQNFRVLYGPDKLPKNLTVQSLLDIQESRTNVSNNSNTSDLILPPLVQSSNNTDSLGSCSNCDAGNVVVTCCAHCHANICPNCHQEHLNIVKISLQEKVRFIQDNCRRLGATTEDFKNKIQEFENCNHRLRHQVANTFDRLIELLDDRKSTLLNQLDTYNQREQERSYVVLSELETQFIRLTSFVESIDINSSDISQIQGMLGRSSEMMRDTQSTSLRQQVPPVNLHFAVNADLLTRCISSFGSLNHHGTATSSTSPIHQRHRNHANQSPTLSQHSSLTLRSSMDSARGVRPPPPSQQHERNTVMTFANPSFRGHRGSRRAAPSNRGSRIARVVSPPPELSETLTRSGTFVVNNRLRNPIAFEVDSSTNIDEDNHNVDASVDYLTMSNPVKVFGNHGNGMGCFNGPRGIAVCDTTGHIFIADSNNHRIERFSRNGEFITLFGQRGNGEGQLDCVTGIALCSSTERIYTTNRFNHKVVVYDMDGAFIQEFGGEGCDDGLFRYPWGICTFDAQLFVADKKNHRVQIFDVDGHHVGFIGSHGRHDGEFDDPHYVAMHPEGRLLLVSDSNNNRIQAFDVRQRSFCYKFGSEGHGIGQMKHPRGVTFDSNGFILVADAGNNRVQVFRPDTTFVCHWGSTGSRPGRFKGVEGVAVMPSGRVVVSDRDNHRIQMF